MAERPTFDWKDNDPTTPASAAMFEAMETRGFQYTEDVVAEVVDVIEPNEVLGKDADGDLVSLPLAESGVPDGGTTGQVLAKASDTNGDAIWANQAAAAAFTYPPVGERIAPNTNRLTFPTSYGQPGLAPDRNVTSCTYAIRKLVLQDFGTDPFMLFSNSRPGGAPGDIDGYAQITVECVVVWNSTAYRATSGGNNSWTIAPGALATAVLPVAFAPRAGDFIFVHTFVSTAGTAGQWPSTIDIGSDLLAGNIAGYFPGTNTTAAPQLLTAQGNSNGGAAYGPSFIGSRLNKRFRSVALYGDSLVAGSGDSDSNKGWLTRALDAVNVPSLRLGVVGDGLPSGSLTRRRAIGQYASDAICDLGVNSLGNPTLRADALATWNLLRASGHQRVYHTTITPVSSGGAGSQTTGPGNAGRIAFNAWLRAGAPLDPTGTTPVNVGTAGALLAGRNGHPLTGFIEAADVVETARDTGIWQTSFYGDGVHPNATSTTALAAAFPLALFDATAVAIVPNYRRVGAEYVAHSYSSLSSGLPRRLDAGTALLIPFDITGSAVKIDRLSCNVTTAGTTGSLIRLWLANSNSEGFATTLIQDAGTQSGESTGQKSFTFTAVTLQPGRYFIGFRVEGEPTTRPQVSRGVGQDPRVPGSVAETLNNFLHGAGASGAAPANLNGAGSLQGYDGLAPIVTYRVAA